MLATTRWPPSPHASARAGDSAQTATTRDPATRELRGRPRDIANLRFEDRTPNTRNPSPGAARRSFRFDEHVGDDLVVADAARGRFGLLGAGPRQAVHGLQRP